MFPRARIYKERETLLNFNKSVSTGGYETGRHDMHEATGEPLISRSAFC
jgi:hypothetical protein